MKISSFLVGLLASVGISAASVPQKDFKPNVFVFSDMSNEPDDAESFVRLLLYTNEMNLKGMVATTSHWLNYTVHDDDMYPIVDAYEKVHDNLIKHSPDYPQASYLRSIISTGQSVYGLEALSNPMSEGAKNVLREIDATPEGEKLYILVWGGANALAEALNEVKKTRSLEKVKAFVDKMFVYFIQDQDNSGPWIRQEFPHLHNIASIAGWNQYGHAAWTGISGEIYNNFDKGGPDSSLVSKEWLEENIRKVGPFGAAYPQYYFNMEGDTPSTLYMIQNGLGDPDHPEYGSWGGRYTRSDPSAVVNNHFGDAQDHVIGQDGHRHTSSHATIWRWRDAYQGDFAARMQWTVKDFDEAPHQPVVVANGTISVKPTYINGTTSSNITFDLSESYDLNGRPLTFKWFHYRENTMTQGNPLEVPAIDIRPKNDEASIVEITVPNFEAACLTPFGRPGDCKLYHFIGEVQNDAGLRTYKRFVVRSIPGDDKIERDIVWEQVFPDELLNVDMSHDEL